MNTKKNYLVFGAGAIGTTVAAWLNDAGTDVSLFDKSEVCDHININGLEIYHGDEISKRYSSKVRAYSNIDDVPTPDVIVLCIKNYSLDGVSQFLLEKFGQEVLFVDLQKGV